MALVSSSMMKKAQQVGFIALVTVVTAFALNWAARKNKFANKVQQATATGDIKRLTT